MQVITEEERWTAIYYANPGLAKRGILLTTFVAYPLEIIELFFFNPHQGTEEVTFKIDGYLPAQEKQCQSIPRW